MPRQGCSGKLASYFLKKVDDLLYGGRTLVFRVQCVMLVTIDLTCFLNDDSGLGKVAMLGTVP